MPFHPMRLSACFTRSPGYTFRDKTVKYCGIAKVQNRKY
jgi:hypothetical protein